MIRMAVKIHIYTTRQKLNNTGFFIQEYFFTEFINNHKIDQINWIYVFTHTRPCIPQLSRKQRGVENGRRRSS